MRMTPEQKQLFQKSVLNKIDSETDEVDAVLAVMDSQNLSPRDVHDLLDEGLRNRLIKSFADRKMITGVASLW
jgi:hypothetical protein